MRTERDILMTDAQRQERQEQVCDLADKFVDAMIDMGIPFTESMCNFSFNIAGDALNDFTPYGGLAPKSAVLRSKGLTS